MQEWWFCLLPLPLFGHQSRKYSHCGLSGLVLPLAVGKSNKMTLAVAGLLLRTLSCSVLVYVAAIAFIVLHLFNIGIGFIF